MPSRWSRPSEAGRPIDDFSDFESCRLGLPHAFEAVLLLVLRQSTKEPKDGRQMSRTAAKFGSPTTGVKKKKGNIFHQRLGSLTYSQACQLLVDEGPSLIREGAQYLDLNHDNVFLGGDLFRVRFEDPEADSGVAIATITLQSGRRRQLQTNCDQCEVPCIHLGAAVDHLLEAKSDLGLAQPPDESVPLEHLTTDELNQRAIADRTKRAVDERMKVRSTNPQRPWTDYIVTSERSGRTYRVALRGFHQGECFCTCPDFRTNKLQTCKHVFHVQTKVRKRFSEAKLRPPYRRKRLSVSLSYGDQRGLLFHLPYKVDAKTVEIIDGADQQVMTDANDAMTRIGALEHAGHEVTIYPDAEAFIQRQLT
jgi:hypothetical protein